MSNTLKISADTSDVKKSILDLGKSFKEIKGSKISIFSEEDKKFMRSELKKEMALTKNRIQANREEIKKMVAEQKKMVDGSKDELEQRKKILEAYKTQAKLGKDLGVLQQAAGGSGGGGIGGLVAEIAPIVAGLAAAAGAWALMKNYQAMEQYKGGVPSRNRLKGLGVDEEDFGSATELAKVGLTEQEMIQRRVEATATLGREGTSQGTEMKKAGFERAYGLQGGTMTGVASSFRGQVGGKEATEMQMRVQGSIIASGIEDAIGPYLKSAVDLLTNINENGTSNTAEMTAIFGQLSKSGERTPEQIAKNFAGINNSVKGSTGESNAFLQMAFAKQGIGGGSIGGTQFALSSGGIMGLNQEELKKRNYNPELLKNMESSGMFSGVGKRTNAIMDMFKTAGGLGQNGKISDITDPNTMVRMNSMSNSVFGTKGEQGFDVLKMLEKVQNGTKSEKEFNKELQKMTEDQDPVAKRLNKINDSLSGQTELLTNIDKNLSEALGKDSVQARNAAMRVGNVATRVMTNAEDNLLSPPKKDAVDKLGYNPNSKSIKDKLLDGIFGVDRYGFRDRNEKVNLSDSEQKKIAEVDAQDKKSADEAAKTLQAIKDFFTGGKTIQNNNTIVLPDGTVSNRINK